MKSTALKTLGVLALSATAASAATIIENDTVFAQNGGGDITTTIDASASSMLVVFVVGEHGFNNTSGQSHDVTYDGVSLTEIVNRDPIASGTDTLYSSIWVMENPSANHTSGTLFADVTTRGNLWAVALSNTAGVGDSGFSATAVRTLDLTTSADSYVAAAWNLGGAGNTAGLSGISADAPLTGRGGQENGSNWDGHYIGTQNGTTAGTTTYGFTGGNAAGALVTAVEILAIPEPSSIALLGLGSLALLRRRR